MGIFIESLVSMQLGMARDASVKLSPPSKYWGNAFAFGSARLTAATNAKDFLFHHVGSTSIPGILAKPILDILAVAPSLEVIDGHRPHFERLGYEVKGEYGIPGRRYCVLYNIEKSIGYVHLHAFAEGHPEILQHLLFRDYLRAFPEKAKAYELMKLKLLNYPGISRATYTEAKAPFIQKVLAEATIWNRELLLPQRK
jgi:GrpB-like predicted nucleotidyltransferase (UPF0157 family)